MEFGTFHDIWSRVIRPSARIFCLILSFLVISERASSEILRNDGDIRNVTKMRYAGSLAGLSQKCFGNSEIKNLMESILNSETAKKDHDYVLFSDVLFPEFTESYRRFIENDEFWFPEDFLFDVANYKCSSKDKTHIRDFTKDLLVKLDSVFKGRQFASSDQSSKRYTLISYKGKNIGAYNGLENVIITDDQLFFTDKNSIDEITYNNDAVVYQIYWVSKEEFLYFGYEITGYYNGKNFEQFTYNVESDFLSGSFSGNINRVAGVGYFLSGGGVVFRVEIVGDVVGDDADKLKLGKVCSTSNLNTNGCGNSPILEEFILQLQ
ncbi:MAG: hypothetical protein RIC54_05305 [Thalassobaculum sp.]|uniref:hypothetical protein n=1 Tax=Thalassobaculum sp. TaxID=2022740 RepID=UPI0032ED96A1